MQTNARLLKQSTEKDDMNAKSLSTILHLKHLTEQLTKEKENLEQQAKIAGQLALSARLTANAKERVAEEVSKETEVSKCYLNLSQDCIESKIWHSSIGSGKFLGRAPRTVLAT
jgi:E3 ubiquitin-protein ligase BRE1